MKNPYDLWIGRVCESEVTPVNYLHSIRYFEDWLKGNYGLDAREIPAEWREAKYKGWVEREKFLDLYKDVLKDYFAHVKAEGYAPYVVNRHMSTVISYMHAFEIPIEPIRLRYPYMKYHNRDLEKEEIRRILAHSTVRNRAVYLILYESGMRPITLTKLRWMDVKHEFLGHKVPLKIDLPSEILKCRVMARWTFIGEEGFNALKTYLVTRLPLKEEDLLFVTEKPKGRKLKTTPISQAFSDTVKKLGLAEPRGPAGRKPKELRLYCLKSAFKKFHGAQEDYKKFWMGRSGTFIHYVSKDPEYHRRLYAEGYDNLRLYKLEIDAETVAKLTRENMDLRGRVERLERILENLGEVADLKMEIKREEKLASSRR